VRSAASGERETCRGERRGGSSKQRGERGIVRGTRVASVRGASGGGPVVQRAGAVPAARKAQAAAVRGRPGLLGLVE